VRSGSREIGRLRRDRFLIANIPTSMHLRIIRVNCGENLRKSGLWESYLLFDGALQAAVTVLQTGNFTRMIHAVRTVELASRIS
jgi:hypothetical protein